MGAIYFSTVDNKRTYKPFRRELILRFLKGRPYVDRAEMPETGAFIF